MHEHQTRVVSDKNGKLQVRATKLHKHHFLFLEPVSISHNTVTLASSSRTGEYQPQYIHNTSGSQVGSSCALGPPLNFPFLSISRNITPLPFQAGNRLWTDWPAERGTRRDVRFGATCLVVKLRGLALDLMPDRPRLGLLNLPGNETTVMHPDTSRASRPTSSSTSERRTRSSVCPAWKMGIL